MAGGTSDRRASGALVGGADAPADIARTMTEVPGRYVVVRELGRGGMGRVDELFDRALGRAVAMKAALPGGEAHATRLIAEAQTCAQLEHPSIVPVYDVGRGADGEPFYTMRSVRGRTLSGVLDDTQRSAADSSDTWSLARLLGVFRQVCLAVDYAHSRGVVHRDLKPDNVIVGPFGEVYVLDWGIAHVLEGSDVRRTAHEAIVAGSPGYMAPEQVADGPVDARTDVFALGVILHRLLGGELPLVEAEAPGVLPPSTARVTDAFDELVCACLARVPDERPRSARALADAVDTFLDGERAHAERNAEATAFVADGRAAQDACLAREAEANQLRLEAAQLLDSVPAWESASCKRPAWDLLAKANALAAEAAHAVARAHAAFTNALSRVTDHPDARRGLASLYFRHFEAAEARSDVEQMAQHLDLARAYDDGDLALELANEGELSIVLGMDVAGAVGADVRLAVPGVPPHVVTCRDVRARGALLEAGAPVRWTPGATRRLEAGSYIVAIEVVSTVVDSSLPSARLDERRFPIVIERARSHRLTITALPSLPQEMVHVPGGPYRTAGKTGSSVESKAVSDFALGRFPVTLRAYLAFLEQIDPNERARRIPRPTGGQPLVVAREGVWRIAGDWVEGEGKKRVPPERELDLPVSCISWYDALAYTRWLARTTRQPYRLPTDVEWDKAMRGADGRPYPMATSLDPSFAKLRESRPEAAQPEPIGTFALDESPYGVRDLAGGVGEWTSTFADGAPAPELTGETALDHADRQAVWCGGAWSVSATAPRLRFEQMARHRVGWVGLRVALSLDPCANLLVEPMLRVW